MANTNNRWYPTHDQLKDTQATHRVFKQVLDQHYALVDKINAMQEKASAPATSGPPPGSGPSDTQICGLFVKPVDVQTLANGATLKFNKANGNFEFV
jgi:hypothetical protein